MLLIPVSAGYLTMTFKPDVAMVSSA